MIIFGIETSCDETAVAILEIRDSKFRILSNIVSSQIEIHKKYGGIVPEVAARKHVEMILLIIKESMERGLISPKEIDLIAVTRGPGLITSLLVGIETAKSLAYIWQKPLIGVNHLEGHLYSSQLKRSKQKGESGKLKEIKFPALCLIASGGHTELVLMKSYWDYEVIGKTLDDAAGEAFDKIAKILGLRYPGGPEISRLAKRGNPGAFNFPRPMIESRDYNFSFAGLKTAVLYKIKNKKLKIKNLKLLQDLVASVEQAIIDVLVIKTIRAVKEFKVKTVMMGGGVAANSKLRATLSYGVKKVNRAIKVLLPEVSLSTDNGVVIALTGYYRSKKLALSGVEGHKVKSMKYGWKKIIVDPNLEL